jgi:hypothetical protein
VARETNFVDLYLLLDVKPDCELAEFKQAYRRRVAVLHPDRRGESRDDQIFSERLKHLTALYSSAIEFERRHGRLPGALHVRPALPGDTDSAASGIPAQHPSAQHLGSRNVWAGVAIAAIAIWLIWSPPWQTESTDSDMSAPATVPAAVDTGQEHVDPNAPATIRIGTTTGTVRALEGEPMIINRNRWEYGPSWVYFQGDTVVDWYSSPLHPLETASPHPQPNDK